MRMIIRCFLERYHQYYAASHVLTFYEEGENITVYYLKQEGEQSYTCCVMFGLRQRAVRLLNVDYVHLYKEKSTVLHQGPFLLSEIRSVTSFFQQWI